VPGMLHCFTGNGEELQQCLDLGLHIGITGWVSEGAWLCWVRSASLHRLLHVHSLVTATPVGAATCAMTV
jgi:Tat protein secretion system quality control protein TatD with DNase activity